MQGLRAEFKERIEGVPAKRRIFLDESGVNIAMTRLYGRAPRGERVVDSVPENWGENVTMIAALGLDGVRAAMSLEGALDGSAFEVFVTDVLVPTLREGDVVVMDNLNVHKNAEAEQAILAAGARIEFLPPYSPDLNPIEQLWSKIKALVGGAGARTLEALEQAISTAFAAVTSSDAEGWFEHCGHWIRPKKGAAQGLTQPDAAPV